MHISMNFLKIPDMAGWVPGWGAGLGVQGEGRSTEQDHRSEREGGLPRRNPDEPLAQSEDRGEGRQRRATERKGTHSVLSAYLLIDLIGSVTQKAPPSTSSLPRWLGQAETGSQGPTYLGHPLLLTKKSKME